MLTFRTYRDFNLKTSGDSAKQLSGTIDANVETWDDLTESIQYCQQGADVSLLFCIGDKNPFPVSLTLRTVKENLMSKTFEKCSGLITIQNCFDL